MMLQARTLGADIIVFPEDGLTGDNKCSREEIYPYLQQIPEIGSNPCLESSAGSVLAQLSCLARKNQLYVVLDLGEVAYCTNGTTNCPGDGRFQYNTQVAFDYSGT